MRLDVPSDGEGDPVVLLPGFGTDISAFAFQTGALVERYCVLGVNPRGVGDSQAPDLERYEVPVAAEDVAAVIPGPAHVIGASLGAAVALELALARPDLVRSLVLITPFVEASARLAAVATSWCQVRRDAKPETLARMLLPWLFSESFLANEKQRELVARGLVGPLARISADTLERTALGLQAWSGSRAGDLAKIECPTLVLVAGGDLLTPDSEALAAALPNARSITVPGAGHALSVEAPDAVNQAIAEHLGQL